PARTIYVMGEFPWRVHVGESAKCDDYIAPPLLLSREQSDKEVTWSLGEYTPTDVIRQAFDLKTEIPAPVGIYANQPAPVTGAVGQAWKHFLLWAFLLMVVQLFFSVFHSHKTVFEQTFSFAQQTTGENSFVTKEFELPGRVSNAEVEINTDLEN